MEIVAILIVAALTFGLCFLADKGFTKVFRGKTQHFTGLTVRLNKKYGAFGLILVVLGISAVFVGLSEGWVMIAGGGVVIALGVGLIVYYMTFGVFYDQESFILTTFGKKSTTYKFQDIRCQQLYNSYGQTVIELHMKDGRAFQLQSGMTGVYPFMDTAFAGWCAQKGINRAECEFHDPDNSCWFPRVEEV